LSLGAFGYSALESRRLIHGHDLIMEADSYQFKKEMPPLVVAGINRLQGNGYFIHKEWENGVEMRRKSAVRTLGIFIRSACILFFPIIGIPFFGRTILDVIYGYKCRIFVLRDHQSPEVFFI
jgi:hypothetical protein